ncbi:putative protein DEK [Helianthus annuus]|nr:putative protein DEK [Helianthus annuus]
MASEIETLEEKKQKQEDLMNLDDVEVKEKEEANKEEEEHDADEKEGSDGEEDESEETKGSSKRGRKESVKKGSLKKSKTDSSPKEPVTPVDRPTRERKTVERYTESMQRLSAPKPFSIEKGSGTQLKDIPNGMCVYDLFLWLIYVKMT